MRQNLVIALFILIPFLGFSQEKSKFENFLNRKYDDILAEVTNLTYAKNFTRSDFFDAYYNKGIKYKMPDAGIDVSLLFKKGKCAIVKVESNDESLIKHFFRNIKEKKDCIFIDESQLLTYEIDKSNAIPIIWITENKDGKYYLIGTLYEP